MSSIKQLIGKFYKRVHPDLMVGKSLEAIECNERSLKELNSYIDRLENNAPPIFNEGPFVARSLPFFQPRFNNAGVVIKNSLRPCIVNLPSIPPHAGAHVLEDISVQLIHEIEKVMLQKDLNHLPAVGKHLSQVLSDVSSKGLQGRLSSLWERERVESYILEYDAERERRNYERILQYNRTGTMDEITGNISVDRMIDKQTVEVIKTGYHPDLLFYSPTISEDDREVGVSRLCGTHLVLDADKWLLENVLRTVYEMHVPIVLTKGSLIANLECGYFEINIDFELNELVIFLQDNLQTVKDARDLLISTQFAPI